MRPYLEDLVQRLADRTEVQSSSDSVSSAVHRKAEQLTDISMVSELAEAARTLPTAKRRGCYFTIGKIGRNLQDEHCAAACSTCCLRRATSTTSTACSSVWARFPRGQLSTCR